MHQYKTKNVFYLKYDHYLNFLYKLRSRTLRVNTVVTVTMNQTLRKCVGMSDQDKLSTGSTQVCDKVILPNENTHLHISNHSYIQTQPLKK